MKDIAAQLEAIGRTVTGPVVGSGGSADLDDEIYTVSIVRTYDAEVADVWDAITDPDRLARWFLPISGDLRVGGAFQLEGNAGGEILACEPPTMLRVTFGMATSIVEVRLAAAGDGATRLELDHAVPAAMAGSGAGALYSGPGWDAAVIALVRYLRGDDVGDPVAAQTGPEATEIGLGSVLRWEAVVTSSGTATPEQLADAVGVAKAQFAPDLA